MPEPALQETGILKGTLHYLLRHSLSTGETKANKLGAFNKSKESKESSRHKIENKTVASQMKQQTIILRRDGSIEWLSPPPFPMTIKEKKKERFSEIIPVHWLPRMTFKLLRKVFGETGRVATWTRRWVVLWRCTILKGPHKGETRRSGLRAVLLDWEHSKFES